jgi:glycosyltransferase involved in cell wall biosynthesis
MRVGLLTTSFPRYEGDIAGQFVLGFARALVARGHDLSVLAPEPHERLTPPSWPGVRLRWLGYLRPRMLQRTFYGAGVPDNLRRDPRAWLGLLPFSAALAAAARCELADCDALVSHWSLPCALAAGAARAGRPHLAVIHSADLHALSRLPGRSRLAARVAGGATALWFVAETQRERFCAWLPRARPDAIEPHMHVQPMGIDDPGPPARERAALRRELGLTGFTLLTIARLVPVKGLVEAVRSLRHRGDLEWLIAGDGPAARQIAREAASARLRVRLLGTVTGARKHALLHAADAFILPSRVLASGRSEGVPTALFEAMAHGLPTVASAVGGIPGAVRPFQSALLFDPNGPQALERAVDRLIADEQLRGTLSARGRTAAQSHGWQAIAPHIEALLAPRGASPRRSNT